MLKVVVQEFRRAKVLHLQGRIGVLETETLRLAVRSQSDADVVILDFAQVIGIDAAGLGTLLELRKWTKAVGSEFRLTKVTERARQVLEITCLDSVFKITSEAEVLFLTTSGLTNHPEKFRTIRPNNVCLQADRHVRGLKLKSTT